MTARVLALAGLSLLALSAAAQTSGDYDGDGDVDGDDFWYWAGCMTGPAGGIVDPNCAAFDFDLFRAPDGKVDLADLAAFGRVFTPPATKVPLGGQVAATTDGGRFRVYVPTKWGGVLTVATTAGTISELKYPDGSPYSNGTETGENKHGWYRFTVTGSSSYTVSATFVQAGQAATRPWNFYWWAKKGDYIREPWSGGNQVADTTALGTDEQIIPPGSPAAHGADIVRCGNDGNLETTAAGDDERVTLYALYRRVNPWRPLDKYEQLHGGWPRSWEAQHDRGTLDWEGHCWGGSMASILLNQPTRVPGTPYDPNGDELEGLWAELGEHSETVYQYEPNHTVYGIPPGPPVPGLDPTDQRVASLHARFEECIRHEHVALQSNLRSEGADPNAVWNHAVYRFTATYSEAPGGNERVVHIVNNLAANADHEPPTNDVTDRAFTYTYIVEYSGGEVLIGVGDFVSAAGQARFAPANLYHVIHADWLNHNVWMTVADVMADDGSN